MNTSGSVNRLQTDALKVPRTRRNHPIAVLTSLPAGKMVPIAAIPMLREDSMNGACSVTVEMAETKEILMNPTNLRVTAYLIPNLALPQFQGSRDQFDRAWMNQPKTEDPGETTTAFFRAETLPASGAGAHEILRYLGMHGKASQVVNGSYTDMVNLVWNMRAKNRSLKIVERLLTDTTLPPAFWQHSRFAHILPDFDQAVIDGEVALSIVNAKLPVRGIGVAATTGFAGTNAGIKDATGNPGPAGAWSGATNVYVKGVAAGAAALPDVFAELEQNGITVSLANIELARKTQAFAKMRERYEGNTAAVDEYIIDMLMDGLTIPDQAMKQPILIADKTVRFAQAKRYSTTAGSMAESAVSGAAEVTISLMVPRLQVGGVVMVFAEAVPEQLFERQQDWLLHTPTLYANGQNVLPNYLSDTLDPEKVDVVKNGDIDAQHATPNATFGYEPLNGKYNRAGPKVGGKFFKGDGYAGSDTVRQRLWAVETANPVLTTDFYVVKNMHTKPFLDTASDPFEVAVVGNAVIEGNTVFGGVLIESTANYDKVMAKAPTERIVKP